MSLERLFSIFNSGGHFVQGNGTIIAIFIKGHPRKISMKLFSSDGHYFQQSETISASLVEGYPGNISMKVFRNRPIGLGEAVV